MENRQMSIFDNIEIDNTIKPDEDRVGGESKKIDKTGKYDVIIKKAYVNTAKSGAMSFVVEVEDATGNKLKIEEYFTNKDKATFYLDKEGNKRYLPGFSKMKALDFLVTKKDQQNPVCENKSIMLYDYTAKKEIPTLKPVFVEWYGKTITILAMNVLENKSVKNEVTGSYEPIAETRNVIVVDHFLDPVTLRTRNEVTAATDAKICADWTAKFGSDYVRDARTIKDGVVTASKPTMAEATADAIFG